MYANFEDIFVTKPTSRNAPLGSSLKQTEAHSGPSVSDDVHCQTDPKSRTLIERTKLWQQNVDQQMKEKNEEIAGLKEELAGLKHQESQLDIEKESAKQKTVQKDAETAVLEEGLQAIHNYIVALRNDCISLENSFEGLKELGCAFDSKHSSHQAIYENLCFKFRERQKLLNLTLEKLKSEMKELEQEKSFLGSQKMDLSERVQILEQRKQAAEAVELRVQQQILDTKQAHISKKHDLEELEESIKNCRAHFENFNFTISGLYRLGEAVSHTTEEALQKQQIRLTTALALTGQASNSMRGITNASQKIDSDVQALRLKNTENENCIVDLKAKLQAIADESVAVRDKYEKLVAENQELFIELQKEEKRSADLEASNQKILDSIDEHKRNNQRDLEETELKIQLTTQTNEGLKSRLMDINKKKEEEIAKIDKLEAELAELEKKTAVRSAKYAREETATPKTGPEQLTVHVRRRRLQFSEGGLETDRKRILSTIDLSEDPNYSSDTIIQNEDEINSKLINIKTYSKKKTNSKGKAGDLF